MGMGLALPGAGGVEGCGDSPHATMKNNTATRDHPAIHHLADFRILFSSLKGFLSIDFPQKGQSVFFFLSRTAFKLYIKPDVSAMRKFRFGLRRMAAFCFAKPSLWSAAACRRFVLRMLACA
jgi:hypothetical protein